MNAKTRTEKALHACTMASQLRKEALPGCPTDPRYVAAWIAHDSPMWCNGDNKVWNSAKGDDYYREVLSLLVGSGAVKVSWNE